MSLALRVAAVATVAGGALITLNQSRTIEVLLAENERMTTLFRDAIGELRVGNKHQRFRLILDSILPMREPQTSEEKLEEERLRAMIQNEDFIKAARIFIKQHAGENENNANYATI